MLCFTLQRYKIESNSQLSSYLSEIEIPTISEHKRKQADKICHPAKNFNVKPMISNNLPIIQIYTNIRNARHNLVICLSLASIMFNIKLWLQR